MTIETIDGVQLKPKRTRPRRGKHERLLRAIAKNSIVMGGGTIALPNYLVTEILYIKQAMDKKGGGK